MNRRKKIRLISFAAAFAVSCIAWGITATGSAKKYKNEVNISQQRALIRLCEYLDNIETDLTKSMYAESPRMLASLSDDLNTRAAGAKTSLSALSTGDTQLYNIYKFLSQVGAYTASLNAKAAAGGSVTAEERETLKTLLSYANSLSKQFSFISELLESRYLSFEEMKDTLISADKASENMVSFPSAASDAEESMTDMPSLIYDGPFSDNIFTRESALLKNEKEISREAAKEKAAQILKTEEKYIAFKEKTNGKPAVYTFLKGNTTVAVTVKGGYLAYMLTEQVPGEEKLTNADCVEKASAFLYDCGYKDMMSTYVSVFDGVCTVNFAYMQDNYICYPDLIKVGVSLTDGSILSLDASDFLMNHTKRDIPAPQISYAQACEAAADTLTVKKGYNAVIPTDAGGEKFTYELVCEDADGRNILVYIDTVSGEEDDILILLYADGGTLTK